MPSKVTDVCCSIDIHFHPALISRPLLLRHYHAKAVQVAPVVVLEGLLRVFDERIDEL